MALRTRVWSAGKIVVLIGTLAATYAIFAVGSMRLALRAREVAAPNLTNRTANEASASIALRSIQETAFPPIPEDLLAALPQGRFTMEESFTIFANR